MRFGKGPVTISAGGRALRCRNALERNAIVIESRAVLDSDEIIVMTASGVVIRMPVSEIRIIGRGTKGVRTIRLDDKDRVIGVAIVQPEIEAVPESNGGSAPNGNDNGK
jgi:DNA gyrase subunit A